MKNIIKLICLFVSVTVMSCCTEPEITGPKKDFMTQDVCGIYSTDEALFVYYDLSCQLYHSPTKYSSRILADDLSKYITITFKSDISAGSTVKGSVSLKGLSGSFKDYDLEILKMENGKAWVWNGKNNIGYLIPWGI